MTRQETKLWKNISWWKAEKSSEAESHESKKIKRRHQTEKRPQEEELRRQRVVASRWSKSVLEWEWHEVLGPQGHGTNARWGAAEVGQHEGKDTSIIVPFWSDGTRKGFLAGEWSRDAKLLLV
jgi:hypothetical protein